MNKFSLVSILCFVAAGACAVGCGSDDDTTTTTAGAGGKSSAGGGGKSSAGAAGKNSAGTGGTSKGDGGSGGAADAGSGGEGGAIETTLYFRLGEHAGIRQAVDAIVGEEVKDPNIASYFSQQGNPAHSPTVGDISECLTIQLSSAAGGPEVYPVTLPSGFTCRTMKEAHRTLGIGGATFDKFVLIAANELTALGVAAADVASVGDVLNGTKLSIVDANVPSGDHPCASPASCFEPDLGGQAGAAGAGDGGAAGAH